MKERLGAFKATFFALAAVLAAASLIPIDKVAEDQLWSAEEAAQYQDVSQEVHRLTYESPDAGGFTEEELQAQRERAQQTYDALREKLDRARGASGVWRRLLLWSAVGLAAAGGACHLAQG